MCPSNAVALTLIQCPSTDGPQLGHTTGFLRNSVALRRGRDGRVYRARDSRLDRDVALKVLPAALAGKPSPRARFEQEARSASALTHPNIVTVFDIGAQEGAAYIITELVAGESLRALIERGPVALLPCGNCSMSRFSSPMDWPPRTPSGSFYDSTRDLYQELRSLRDHLSESFTTDSGVAEPVAKSRRRWLRLVAFRLSEGCLLFWLDCLSTGSSSGSRRRICPATVSPLLVLTSLRTATRRGRRTAGDSPTPLWSMA